MKIVLITRRRSIFLLLLLFSSSPLIFLARAPSALAQDEQPIVPDDPSYLSQWSLRRIRADFAWHYERGSPDIIIAVADSGIRWDDPDLAANIWFGPDGKPGYSALNWTKGPDYLGHGTTVARIAASVTNNTRGYAGVCWNCRLMAIQVNYYAEDDEEFYSALASGIRYAVDRGARVVNMSFGDAKTCSALPASILAAFRYALSKGVVLVASAGNNSLDLATSPQSPVDCEVITVGATDADDLKDTFSNFGAKIDVMAPGWLGGIRGTSFSAPHVAGLVGLILSAYPALSAERVRWLLRLTADPIERLHLAKFEGKLGAGRINAIKAVLATRALRAIDDANATIRIATNEERYEGLDRASNLLEQSWKAFQSGDYRAAFKLATDAKAASEKAIVPALLLEAKRLIFQAKQEIDILSSGKLSEEIQSFLNEAREEIARAQALLAKGDWATAKQHAQKALELTTKARAAQAQAERTLAQPNGDALLWLSVAGVAALVAMSVYLVRRRTH